MTTDKTPQEQDGTIDYSDTLFLPKTDYPMRAGLPKKEPEILARWKKQGIYKTLRENSKGREKFVLHDGPPYANGNLHIGHALNKILKDVITRSHQMMGYDSNYVPGWDCHGLPIEWKIEEKYRAKGKNKDEVPINEFRQECRDFAKHWVGIQSGEFIRLGVEGDFERPYLTMNFEAEAHIAQELMKFATSGQLYRGSKPIMWSVVERTALAEAEIEYQTYESDTVWVPFPIAKGPDELTGSKVVIWTTTPWTIPANRAVCYSDKISYSLYEVTAAENDFGPQPGDQYIFADALAQECFNKAKLEFKHIKSVEADELAAISLDHPLKAANLGGYDFTIPMLNGDHVTDDAGTGFVHTAPSHGRDDFDVWMSKAREVEAMGISSDIPFTVDDAGFYTKDVPGLGPDAEGGAARVVDDKGKKGDANQRVITALIGAGNLFARGRVKHDYPHSWRSKKPVIFRNTPQWFVYMDKEGVVEKGTLRTTALSAIDDTRFVPPAGQKRLRGMIEGRPDWVLSRQRAWGVPICVFVDEDGNVLKDDGVNARIFEAFKAEGADAWYAEGARERFLEGVLDADKWKKVDDILDVWFDSGCTHAFCLEQREDLKWPADVYLEGSDQHRGWFHSSLLESCGTRGRAPYETVVTHGFTMDDKGRKMSKSLGNQTSPHDIIKQYGADILRLWVMTCDYTDDQRIGPEIIKTNVDSYRRLRNTLRWMLGTLAHYEGEEVAHSDMPELERYMLHRLCETQKIVEQGYRDFDFKKVYTAIFTLMNIDMSSFYFDIRKDALYCDPISSVKRKAALQVVELLFRSTVTWLAPMLSFTTDETWANRYGEDVPSVHLLDFVNPDSAWLDNELAGRWEKIRKVRRVVTGALEIERAEKRIGSSLEAAPTVYISNADLATALEGVSDFEDLCITSAINVVAGEGPSTAFSMEDVSGVRVVPEMAEGKKCARSWRISPDVGSDPDYPDITPRDAQAMREINQDN
ncbi:MAG: isoleucine--tRNA ligase [Hyphomicrobiales bacterium]